MIVIIGMNIFVSSLTSSYYEANRDRQANKYELVDYIIRRFTSYLPSAIASRIKKKESVKSNEPIIKDNRVNRSVYFATTI